HRWVLRSIKEAALNGDMVLRKKLPPIFAHHEQLCILMVGQKLHRFLNYVLVVRARKPLIRRDHKAAIGAVERIAAAYGVEILAVDVLIRAKDALDLRLERMEVWPGFIQLALCLAHFG